MESILDWNTKEGKIFRGGSGSGINLSNIRGSMEPLAKGGTASGPVSFMRGADSWAGTIKSGGKTRRAAKMVVLDVDHPDIREFIWCKAREEEKAEALARAGFDMSIDGDGFQSIQYQNANNSVRVTDAFMHAVENDDDWRTTARTTGEPIGEPIPARELMRDIAEAAWRCADPGVQYDTTINQWHTSPNSGRINASNPCSEYMHVDDSACNLASLNLMKFRRPDGTFDVDAFEHTVDIVFLAQEIIVGPSSYPTEEIALNARAFRQLGLGYANLGAFLMANGMPYDSDAGRATAAAITALMTGRAYRGSAKVAAALGPYERYEENREPHNAVMRMHRDASYAIPEGAMRRRRRCSTPRGARGRRPSSSASARLPQRPGDGARPDRDDLVPHGLRHDRHRARLLAREVQGARRRRADDDRQPHDPDGAADDRLLRRADRADRGLRQRARDDHRGAGPRRRAPAGLRRGGRRARDLAHGPHQDDGRRPAVPLGRDLEDGQHAARRRRSTTSPRPTSRRGAAASRRSRSTATARRPRRRCAPRRRRQSARRRGRDPEGWLAEAVDARVAEAVAAATAKSGPARKRMPRERQSITHKFSIGGHEGYITAGMYEDGTIGEIFLTDIGKEGSTLRGMMNSFATSISIALQYGVPLETLVQKFSYMRFEPGGDHPEPGDPVREVDARLHHALAGVAVPRRRHAGGARHPDPGGPRAEGGRGGRVLARRRHRRPGERRDDGGNGERRPHPARERPEPRAAAARSPRPPR